MNLWILAGMKWNCHLYSYSCHLCYCQIQTTLAFIHSFGRSFIRHFFIVEINVHVECWKWSFAPSTYHNEWHNSKQISHELTWNAFINNRKSFVSQKCRSNVTRTGTDMEEYCDFSTILLCVKIIFVLYIVFLQSFRFSTGVFASWYMGYLYEYFRTKWQQIIQHLTIQYMQYHIVPFTHQP